VAERISDKLQIMMVPSDAKIFFIGEGPGENEDLTGRPFRLASLRGRKALIVAWASW